MATLTCKLCLRLGEACCSLLLPKLWYLENDSIGHHLVKPQQQKELWRCSRASGSAHVGVTANTSNIEIVWKAVNRLNHFNGLWPKSKSKSVKGETTSSHNLTFLKGYETSQAHVNYVTSWVYMTFTAWKNDAIKLNSDWGCQSSPLRFPGGKSNGFGATWVWVNDDRILIFEGTIPLKPRKKDHDVPYLFVGSSIVRLSNVALAVLEEVHRSPGQAPAQWKRDMLPIWHDRALEITNISKRVENKTIKSKKTQWNHSVRKHSNKTPYPPPCIPWWVLNMHKGNGAVGG